MNETMGFKSSNRLFPKLAAVALFLLLFCGDALRAETRLLTGDLAGAIHAGGGEIKDLAGNGDLVLFTALVPSGPVVPGITQSGLYLRKLTDQTLVFVGDTTVAHPGVRGAVVSDDGRYLSWGANDQQIYWRDRQAGTTRLVTGGITAVYGNPRISADGRYVAFMSNARTLIADTSKLPDSGRAAVYVYDSQTSTTSIASLSSTGGKLTGVGLGASIYENFDLSADGRFVVFATEDVNAHPHRTGNMENGFTAVYRRNLATGELLLLNRNSAGQVANGNFLLPRISADGNRVAFLGGYNGRGTLVEMIAAFPMSPANAYDVYVKDVSTAQVWGVTKTTDGSAHIGLATDAPVISGTGSVVAFASESGKLIPNDDPGALTFLSDVFRADLSAIGTVQLSLATRPEAGATSSNVTHDTTAPLVSGDGGYVAYGTYAFANLGFSGISAMPHGVGVGTFPAPAFTGVPYFIWALSLPFDKQGANANPSGDGVPNLVKYFIGSSAHTSDLRYLPVKGIARGDQLGLPADARNYMTLSVRIRRGRPPGYDWGVETSPTLSGLISAPVPAIQVSKDATDPAFDVYLFRYPTEISGKGFMRLKTVLPPGAEMGFF